MVTCANRLASAWPRLMIAAATGSATRSPTAGRDRRQAAQESPRLGGAAVARPPAPTALRQGCSGMSSASAPRTRLALAQDRFSVLLARRGGGPGTAHSHRTAAARLRTAPWQALSLASVVRSRARQIQRALAGAPSRHMARPPRLLFALHPGSPSQRKGRLSQRGSLGQKR